VSQRNIAASVRARLLNLARERGQNFELILTRFCLERLLYPISISPSVDQFLLKGAMLFDLWYDIPHRPTRYYWTTSKPRIYAPILTTRLSLKNSKRWQHWVSPIAA